MRRRIEVHVDQPPQPIIGPNMIHYSCKLVLEILDPPNEIQFDPRYVDQTALQIPVSIHTAIGCYSRKFDEAFERQNMLRTVRKRSIDRGAVFEIKVDERVTCD